MDDPGLLTAGLGVDRRVVLEPCMGRLRLLMVRNGQLVYRPGTIRYQENSTLMKDPASQVIVLWLAVSRLGFVYIFSAFLETTHLQVPTIYLVEVISFFPFFSFHHRPLTTHQGTLILPRDIASKIP